VVEKSRDPLHGFEAENPGAFERESGARNPVAVLHIAELMRLHL
jgi:hypothetical protein